MSGKSRNTFIIQKIEALETFVKSAVTEILLFAAEEQKDTRAA